MQELNLKKLFFMLFEIQDFKGITKLYFDYRYMVQDASIEIIHSIAKAITGTIEERDENLQNLYNAKTTEEFPLPKGFIPEIFAARGESVTPKYADIKSAPGYHSPGYNMISVNGNTYDAEMDLVKKVNACLGDSVRFKELVDSLQDKNYSHYLKLIHALNTYDIDYGLEAAEYFLDKEIQNLSIFVLIINLLEAKQRLDLSNDISQSQIYKKLQEILKDTLYSINLLYIKKWTLPELDFIKEYKIVKDSLLKTHPENVITEYYNNLKSQNSQG